MQVADRGRCNIVADEVLGSGVRPHYGRMYEQLDDDSCDTDSKTTINTARPT